MNSGRDKSRIFGGSSARSRQSTPFSQKGSSNSAKLTRMVMDEDNPDPEEFLMKLQHERTRDQRRGKRLDDEEEKQGVNAFSRPMLSKIAPLRSNLLDPMVNNFPQSKTQSEYHRKLKQVNQAHSSYDVDGDGYVSQEDYFLAKRFDLDGNGVLDPQEQEVGRFMIAQQFFKDHKDDIHLYGKQWQKTERTNVKNLASAHTFQKLLGELKQIEKHNNNIGSHGAYGALTLEKKDLLKHNYYTDKFDTTAWNDHGADPRQFDPHATAQSANEHGSRHKMNHLRKVNQRDTCQQRLHEADEKRQEYTNRRFSLITNWNVENS